MGNKKKTVLLKVVEEETFKFEVDDNKLQQIMSILGSPVAVKSSTGVKPQSPPQSENNPQTEKTDKRERYHYDDKEIKRLLKEGKSIPQIAKHFDIPAQSMRNYVNKNKPKWDFEPDDSSEDD